MDPMRTVPFSMMPMTRQSGDKRCLLRRDLANTTVSRGCGDCLLPLKGLRVPDAAADLPGLYFHFDSACGERKLTRPRIAPTHPQVGAS